MSNPLPGSSSSKVVEGAPIRAPRDRPDTPTRSEGVGSVDTDDPIWAAYCDGYYVVEPGCDGGLPVGSPSPAGAALFTYQDCLEVCGLANEARRLRAVANECAPGPRFAPAVVRFDVDGSVHAQGKVYR